MTAAPAPTRRLETAEFSSDDSPARTVAQSLREFAALAGLLCRTSFASIVVHGIEFTWHRDSGRPSGAFPEHGSFDEQALSGDGVFEVPDTRRDRRFQSAIISYAAIPLRTADGRTLGILSVLDFAPREARSTGARGARGAWPAGRLAGRTHRRTAETACRIGAGSRHRLS